MNLPSLDHWRRKDVVGMDIGSHATKFLRWDHEKKSWSAFYYPGDILSEGEKETRDVGEFMRAHGLHGASVACALDEEAFKSKKFDLPRMPESDLKEAVRWEMRDAVDGSIDNYIIRHIVLDERSSAEGTRLSLMGFAMKAADIRELVQFLKKCSLKPMSLEPAPLSLVAAFGELNGFVNGHRYGVIDLGEKKAEFAAMGDGKLYFSRHLTDISGADLKKYLAKELAIPEASAENMTRILIGEASPRDDQQDLVEQGLSKLSGYLNRFAVELQGSIDAFALNFGREKIDELFLCGGGATLQGLKEHLSENLAIPTSVLDPSDKFGIHEGSPHLFAIAAGLAQHPI